ncbi:MAG TPA: hypothetical protein VF101_18305 [Gaiellaceae bacterium]
MVADTLALWTEILAIATFALAVVGTASLALTRKLATSAERAADAAQRTAEADRLALQGAVRPLLTAAAPARTPAGRSEVDLSFHALGDPSTYKGVRGTVFVHNGGITNPAVTLVSVPIKNVGAGVAVVGGPPRIRPKGMAWETAGTATSMIIGADGLSRLQWVVGHRLGGERFDVEVDYTDARGGQPMRTRLRVEREVDSAWSVTGIALYERGEEGSRLLVRSGDWAGDDEEGLC